MQIVTVCSHFPDNVDYYTHRAFFQSCRKWSFEPQILGREGYGGLGSKPRLLQQAIESGRISDDFIIYTDAFDVFFQQSPAIILERFNKGKLFFNAEKNLFPYDEKLEAAFPPCNTPYRYLNSGFSCGPTELYLQALKEMNALNVPDDFTDGNGVRHEVNDQTLWLNQCVNGHVPIELDHQCEMCQNMAGVHESEIIMEDKEPRLIRNIVTGTTPISIHLAGRKEEWKPKLLNHLGLPL